MEAYCLKCKEKREMTNPEAGFMANGAPVTRGTCSVCGAKMNRVGATEAHEGLVKPEIDAEEKKTRKTASGSKSGTKSGAKTPSKAVRKMSGAKSKAKGAGKTVSMKGKKLVIVESPAKARTVGNFLGKDYVVRASVGHVRDLKKSTLSVDVENDFAPSYRVPNEKRELVKEFKTLAAGADKIYLATDPDREGEAIAWHLMESMEMNPNEIERVVFHEITKPAIAEAFAHPREIDMCLVDAQQARRILDRLVGYNLSPLLWNKVQRGLSAGRVQSVAVRLIVDREREIENFTETEYWSISAEFQPEDSQQRTFISRLIKIAGQDPVLPNQETVDAHLAVLEKASFNVDSVKRSVRRRHPSPPFTTSTLQQEASRKSGFTAKRTMALAQQLYEGVDIPGEGSVGLITYMRTDSTNISTQAKDEARQLIGTRFGNEYLPAKPPEYRTRAQRAQEAHEAIRPTSCLRHPDALKSILQRDQFRLYQLIWQRFVASQMEDALYDTVMVDVRTKNGTDYLFRSSGSKLKFQGFLAVYEESGDEDAKSEEIDEKQFIEGLEAETAVRAVAFNPEQHFTQPPARYTEATLVKALEENGIGRPSTYASILSTIQDRGYVHREAKRLYPTETGTKVTDLLVGAFPTVLNVGFTSEMENELDSIADGEDPWQSVVGNFYREFEPALQKAVRDLPKTKIEPEKTGRTCPECGKELVIRNGRFGKFISCSGFPSCRYTEQIVQKINVPCPKCGKDIIVRHARTGRLFYGCSGYPDCDFTSWKRPSQVKCPSCGGFVVEQSQGKLACTACGMKIEADAPVTVES